MSQDIRNMPVMKAKCKTCPFGENGDKQIAARVSKMVLKEASQVCHSTGWPEGTHLCRGARDIQLQAFADIGFIACATDAAWDAKRKEYGI